MKHPFRFVVVLSLLGAIGSLPATGAEPTAAADDLSSPFARAVRDATAPFRRLEVAEAAGYGVLHGCVTGPGGAMGVHYVNGGLVGDPALEIARPEVVMYEWQDGQPRLIAVEYVVLAEAWHAANDAPPVLGGQLFSYTGAPNRYGIPAFYSLHVWAWQQNPDGLFADYNRKVSCAGYPGAHTTHDH